MDKIKKTISIVMGLLIAIVYLSILVPSNSRRIGGGYWYDIEGKRIFGPDIDIPPVVEKYEHVGDYIIVKQKPNHWVEESTYERKYIYPRGRDTSYYWLIDLKHHVFVGPMSPEELMVEKKRIGILQESH